MKNNKTYQRYTAKTGLERKKYSYNETLIPAEVLNREINVYQNRCVIKFLEKEMNIDINTLSNIDAIKQFLKELEKKENIKIKECAYFYNERQPLVINTFHRGVIETLPSKHIQLSYESEGATLFGYN